MKLTGNRRFRTNWRNQLILQVEERGESHHYPDDTRQYTAWRDAKPQDIFLMVDIKHLVTE